MIYTGYSDEILQTPAKDPEIVQAKEIRIRPH